MWAARLLCAELACWLTLLLGIVAGRTRWLICTREQTFAITPIAMLATLGLAFPASQQFCCSAQPGGTCVLSTPRTTSSAYDSTSEWFTTIPSTLFAALLVQATMHFLVSTSTTRPRKLFVAPCMAVHCCTLLYYLFGETVGASCVLTTRWGTEVRPLHYSLWWVSMSAQLLTLEGLERAMRPPISSPTGRAAGSTRSISPGRTRASGATGAAHAAAAPAAAPAVASSASASGEADRRAARRCALGLAAIPTMLLLTLYVDVLRGPVWMHLGVFGAFYTILLAGIASPLLACSSHVATTTPAVLAQSLRFRFRAVAAYLLFVWHSFPLVWFLDVIGVLTPHQSRMGYVIADVLAKFLPINLYITAVLEPRF